MKSPVRPPVVIGFFIIVLLVVVVAVLIVQQRRGLETVSPAAPPPVLAQPDASPPDAPPGMASLTDPPLGPPEEIVVPEMKYLPETVLIPAAPGSSVLEKPDLPAGTRRLQNVRPLLDAEKDGPFLAPRWSPDGLQMLVTRPGFSGVFLVSSAGGEPIHLADGNAFKAEWTADGKVRVPGEDGKVRTYNADGTLESTEDAGSSNQTVYAENDTVYYRPEPGAAPIPLTGGEDRYFNPVVSPDGRYVLYQGLNSGLYMAPTDQSSSPVYLGAGYHPCWLPDSSGFLYDVTSDDGHNLTAGTIYYTDVGLTERTPLTDERGPISQMPTIGPDGQSVAFEAGGSIYTGELR